jgi:uncharacterized RDD family membrane protein YckC
MADTAMPAPDARPSLTSGRAGYAGVVSRTAAFVVDAVIVVIVALIGVAGLDLLSSVLAGATSRVLSDAAALLVYIGPAVVMVVYNSAFWALIGRTPGMLLFGLRVTRTGGKRVGVVRALVRALALAVLFWGVVWCPFDRRGQALHDKVAATVVVYNHLR